MKYTPSPIREHTPTETRHDWLNAWLKHDKGVERFASFISDCFETHPDIPEHIHNKRANEEALSIIDDVYCGRFKKLKQYPTHHIPKTQEDE
jgi:hypothetical protein